MSMKGFENIIGYEDIKEELCQITDILQNSERYRRLGVTKPAGVLLHGVPGVGKTLMVKSLADASGRKVFYCRKDEPDGDFIRTLKDVFTKAGNEAPSVIILDDMDKYADVSRYDQDAEEYVTIQSCIDDAKDKDVFVAATANSIYPFPRSLLRPGRFDRIIEVEVPRGKDAESIVAHYIKEKAFVDDIDARTIARIMDGRSCAELEKVINEAGIFAGYQNSNKITMDHFLEACMRTVFHAPACSVPKSDADDFSFLTETLMNYCNESRLLPQVICHEAGHAVGQGDAGQYRDSRAELAELFEQRLDFSFVHVGLVGRVGHEAGFGDIWDDDVRVAAEFGVALRVVEVEGRVEGAVVGHNRVDKFQGLVVRREGVEDFFDHFDLFERAEVAGVNAVKSDAFILPVLGDRRDLIA